MSKIIVDFADDTGIVDVYLEVDAPIEGTKIRIDPAIVSILHAVNQQLQLLLVSPHAFPPAGIESEEREHHITMPRSLEQLIQDDPQVS